VNLSQYTKRPMPGSRPEKGHDVKKGLPVMPATRTGKCKPRVRLRVSSAIREQGLDDPGRQILCCHGFVVPARITHAAPNQHSLNLFEVWASSRLNEIACVR